MTSRAEKHSSTIEEAAARLVARAENSRGLAPDEVAPRVRAALEKYLLGEGEDVSGAEVRAFVDELRADDLCLILACEKGDEKAWEDLVAGFDGAVKAAARRVTAGGEDADDLASSIWAELYGLRQDAAGNKKSKLAYYSGRGSLAGWLRAVVSQLAVDEFRKSARLVQIEETREFENLANESAEKSDYSKIVGRGDNPEEIFSEQQTSRDVAAALKEAIDALEAEDRLILKLYYFEDLKLKNIGASLGFHEATASRRLTRVQSEIRRAVEKSLRSRCGWSEEEVKRHLAETASKLGINLEKMFVILLALALVQEIF